MKKKLHAERRLQQHGRDWLLGDTMVARIIKKTPTFEVNTPLARLPYVQCKHRLAWFPGMVPHCLVQLYNCASVNKVEYK